MNNELVRELSSLKLSGMVKTLAIRNQEALSSKLAYTDFLELLGEDELNKRRDRLFARHLKQARVPEIKHLEEFDWSFNPKLPKTLIFDLAYCPFYNAARRSAITGPSRNRENTYCYGTDHSSATSRVYRSLCLRFRPVAKPL